MDKPWFMYDIVVPFGDHNYDVNYGGAHDLDIGAPANYPVTALLPGTILSITDGKDAAGTTIWGRQVGIRLDSQYNGIPNMAYLHLSAVNPALRVGQHISRGDIIGWVGGGSSEADYAGTSNPTGSNFLDTSGRSSRTQVGVALMRGPEYGNTDFNKWQPVGTTPVETELNPKQIILDAQQAFLKGEDDMLQITDPFAAQYFTETATTPITRWHCAATNQDVIGGILAFYRKIGGAPRLPTSGEMRPNPHQNVVYQEFEAGVIVYDPGNVLHGRPAGFGEAYLLMLNSDEVKRIICG